jgi:hypothetical protein
VVLGAVALARSYVGRSPFKKRYVVHPDYPAVKSLEFGRLKVGRKTYQRDVCLTVDGAIKKRKKKLAREAYGHAHVLGPKEVERVCRGAPEVLFVGNGHSGGLELTEEARRYLAHRAIECKVLATPDAAAAYTKSKRRKAGLFHVTC